MRIMYSALIALSILGILIWESGENLIPLHLEGIFFGVMCVVLPILATLVLYRIIGEKKEKAYVKALAVLGYLVNLYWVIFGVLIIDFI